MNKRSYTLFTWSVQFHMCVVGGLENVETLFYFWPSIGQHFSRNCQNRILNLWLQCAYVRNRRNINRIFYPKEKVHRCDIGWARRPRCGKAATNPTIRESVIWKFSRIRKPVRWFPILLNNYPLLIFQSFLSSLIVFELQFDGLATIFTSSKLM